MFRTTALQTLTELFCENVICAGQDIPEHFEEVMCALLPRVPERARAEVARRLAHSDRVPAGVVKLLIADDAPVSGPMLRESPAITAGDLMAIAASGPADKAQAIAARSDLPGEVVAALISRADPVIGTILSASPGFALDGHEADGIARIPGLPLSAANRLVDVAGLSDQALATLFWRLEANGRRRVAERMMRRRAGLVLPPPGTHAEADAAIGEMLVRHAARGRTDDLIAHFELKLSCSEALARRIVTDPGGEPLALAARATRLPLEHVTGLVLLTARDAAASYPALRDIVELAEIVDPEVSLHLVGLWRQAERATEAQPSHREHEARPAARHEQALARPPALPARPAASTQRRLEEAIAEVREARR